MKFMGRAARMERHHKRHKGGAGINLVSMMDIFTILVFFLLVNSSEVEVLPNAKEFVLPDSTYCQSSRCRGVAPDRRAHRTAPASRHHG